MKRIIAIVTALVLVACMVLPVMAEDGAYAPSVELKTPEIVAPEVGDDVALGEGSKEDVKAILVDGEGDKSAVFEIEVVSLEDAADRENDIEKKLIEAYLKLGDAEVEGLAELAAELGFENPGFTYGALFDVTVKNAEQSAILDAENTTVTICFDNTAFGAEAGSFIVIHMVGDKWEVVPAEDVKVDEEIISVTFADLCPIAFLNVSEVTGGDDTDTSESEETTELETESVESSETETSEIETTEIESSDVETTEDESDDKKEDETKDDKNDKDDKDDKDDKKEEDDDTVIIATIVIVSVTVVIIIGIVVFYFFDKKGVFKKKPGKKKSKKY